MAGSFQPLTAEFQSLVRQNYGRIDIPIPGDPGASSRYDTNKFIAHLEVVRPPTTRGRFDLLWQLDEARDSILNLLRKYGRIVRDEMYKPTKEWQVKPLIKAGVPGKGTSTAVPVNFSRGQTEVSTGAYVEASGEHSPWVPRQKGEKMGSQAKTPNDAAWHYIWANDGTKSRLTSTRMDGEATQLVFLGNYNASTRRGSLDSVRHSSKGPIVRKSGFITSKVEARDFLSEITKEQTPKFHRACTEAIAHAIDKYFDHHKEYERQRRLTTMTVRD